MNGNEKKHNDRLLFVVAVLLIAFGGFEYIVFRPRNLMLFQLVDALYLSEWVDNYRRILSAIHLPDFVVYSLPAGLWTTSYLIIMYCITRCYHRYLRLKLSLPLPISAVVLEIAQFFTLCPGTFDFVDLVCYLIPISLFIIYA